MLRARIVGVGAALVLGLGLAAPDAGAAPEGVEAALQLYREGALSDALAAFRGALEAGGNDRTGLATIYLHLGILSAGARDPAGAERAFLYLLSLDQDAAPPEGSSPLVTEPFEQARSRRRAHPPLGIEIQGPGVIEVGRTITIRVGVHGDPGLTHEARATASAGGVTVATASAGHPFRLVLPARASAVPRTLQLRVSLHDEHGSLLDEATETATVAQPGLHRPSTAIAAAAREPGPRGVVARAPEEEDGSGSVLASPWFWGGAAVAVAGGVVAALLLTRSGDDQAHFGPVEVQR